MPSSKIRKPCVAGMFYPASPEQLTAEIESYLTKALPKTTTGKTVRGIVSPHAGYVYSGPVAGWGFKQVQGEEYDTVIVISPSHQEAFDGCSIYGGEAYQTPLGNVAVDLALGQKIAAAGNKVVINDAGHQPAGWGRGEHALEVQLPFLQVALKNSFKIVPIVMGHQMPEIIEDLSDTLAKTLFDVNFLIIASSDLSHYHSYEEAKALDREVVDLFINFNDSEMMRGVASNRIEACGGGPIVSMMKTLRQMGEAETTILNYATSGDVPEGEKNQVVGYMSGMITLRA